MEPKLLRDMLAGRAVNSGGSRQLDERGAAAGVPLPGIAVPWGVGLGQPALSRIVPGDHLFRHVAPQILERAGFVGRAGSIEPDHPIDDIFMSLLVRRGIGPHLIDPGRAVAGILVGRFPNHPGVIVIPAVGGIEHAVVEVASRLRIGVEKLELHPVGGAFPPSAGAIRAVEARATAFPGVAELMGRGSRGRVIAGVSGIRHRIEKSAAVHAGVGSAAAAIVPGHQEIEVGPVFVAIGRGDRLVDVVQTHLDDPAVPHLFVHLQVALGQLLGHGRAGVAVVVTEVHPEMVRPAGFGVGILAGIDRIVVEVLRGGNACRGKPSRRHPGGEPPRSGPACC